ncbi:MAG: VOC family protein [Clostridiales bacterium]|jgi:lactoylglutathione lyase|nr:VOC family protein [Clostridiales bacterium]
MEFNIKDCIKKYSHSGFIVKNLDRSLEFYRDILGMELKMRWIETPEQCDVGMGVPGCTLELAQLVGYGGEIELIQFLTAEGTDAPIAPNHISIGHPSFEVNDLASLVEYLESKGVKMASERMIVPELNITWIHALDPDGIRIELMQFLNQQ